MNKLTMKTCTALAALLIAVPAWAAQDAARHPAEETLSGDWSAWRNDLHKRGINVDVGYKFDLMRNVSGGISRGGRSMSHLDVQWSADLGKLWGWDGTTLMLNFIDDRGATVNASHVGSLLGVSNIEVPRATHRLYQAWIQKEFLDGQLAVLAGLYPVDTEFAVLDSAGAFTSPPYGAWADYALSRGPSIFNNASFGTRVKWTAEGGERYLQMAVLDGIPGDPAHSVGTHVRFNAGDGTQFLVEAGYQPQAKEGEESVAKYLIGYWRYSRPVADLVDADANGDPLNRRSSGWYAAMERALWQADDQRSLVAFARYSANDGNSMSIASALNLGLRLNGPLSGRPGDVLGLAWTRAGISAKYRSAQAAGGVTATDKEEALELTYLIRAYTWLTIQPVLQYIRHPGADAAVHSARIAGVRAELSF